MRSEETPLSSGDGIMSVGRQRRCCGPLSLLQCCNLSAITLLTGAVIFLFIQMQVVTYKVAVEQQKVNDLLTEIQNNQQSEINDLSDQVQEEHDLTVLHMSGTFVLLACLVAAAHVSMHVRHFHEPFVQRKIIAIIFCGPIYGLTAFLSLMLPSSSGYLAIIKDFYEAFLIYTFLSFLIAVLGRGDRNSVVQLLAKDADHLDNPTRCLSRFYHPPPSESPEAKANAVLLECQILAMQFVFVRPVTSIISFVIETLNDDNESSNSVSSTDDDADGSVGEQALSFFASPHFAVAMVTNLSVFFAFTGLLKFYHAVQNELSWCRPLPKFLCIKGIVFLTFWQGLTINIVVSIHEGGRWETNDTNESDGRDRASEIQNILICLEMLLFSIAHVCCFPPEEWEEGYRPREYAKPGIGLKDFAQDVGVIMQSRRAAGLSRVASKEQALSSETASELNLVENGLQTPEACNRNDVL